MKIVKPLDLGLLHRIYLGADGRFRLAIGATLFFDLHQPETLLPEQEMWGFVPGQLGETPLDAGMPKARGELLLVGSCHAPGGAPTPSATVNVRVGALQKSLAGRVTRCTSTTSPVMSLPLSRQ